MPGLLNTAEGFREEMLEGLVAAYGDIVRRVPGASGIVRRTAGRRGKTAVLIGGGSGHFPAFAGMVGLGLADGAVVGEVFTSPSSEQVYRCIREVDCGGGVLLCYGNYSGDVMNFGMAQRRARKEGVDVRTVVVTDDVLSAPAVVSDRRGIAGDFFVFKVAGAASESGYDLDGVERMARYANSRTRSAGVGFGGCTLPGQSAPLFTVGPGMMEVGLGIHGERGIGSAPWLPAKKVAGILVDSVISDQPDVVGSEASVLLNGLGTTKYEELLVLYGDVDKLLRANKIMPYRPVVGEVVTSLDMAGCSLSLLWLDEELKRLIDAPAVGPGGVYGAGCWGG